MISRLARKRRARRAATQPDHPFTITSCEYLTDGAFALLRVGGTGSVAPVALVTQGDGPEAFDPLPQPDAGADNGAWQIAFALPTEAIEPGARVWLHDGGLYLADLRIPSPAQPEPKASEVGSPALGDDDPGADDARTEKLVEAWSETARLREKLSDREEELAQALKDLLDARAALEPASEDVPKKARRSLGRRNEDRAARRQIQQLEAELAERDQRIDQLEMDAESFAARREEAVAASLRERIAAVEEDARQRAAANEELRSLLASEREMVATTRREVEELQRQLAAAGAAEAVTPAAPLRVPPRPVAEKSPNGTPSPPWSALDDELLARIEKAKALTR